MTDINEIDSPVRKTHSMIRAFGSRNYRLYFMGQGISLVGSWMQNVALSWLVYRLTKSSFLLGLVGFISQVPMMLLTPVAGVLADRWNRYRMLIVVQTGLMILAFILSFLVFTHWITIWYIIAIGMLMGVANSADAPVRHSFIIQLVERREDLSNAIALNSAMFNSARLIGPSVAGLLIAWVGEGLCFLLNALSFLAVIFALLAMKIPPQDNPPVQERGVLKEFNEGVRYTFGSKPIRLLLLHFAFVGLFSMTYIVLLPVLATEILKGGASSLGFLMGAMGTGALISSIYMAARKDTAGLWKLAAVSSTVFGIGLIALSFSRSFVLSLLIMCINGFGMINIMTSTNTYIQTTIEDSKRARVMAFYLLAFFGTVPVGNLITGSIAETIGVPTTILIAGIISIIGSITFFSLFSAYIRGNTGK